MMNAKITPTEALLKVAKARPFAPAIRSGKATWSYTALWQRVRRLATKIDEIEPHGRAIGLFMGLEVDYIAGAHAVWLSGRTVVILSQKWTPAVLDTVLARADVGLILYGDLAPSHVQGIPSVCTYDFVVRNPPANCAPPPSHETVDRVPLVCSVTPTSGSTGVPKSIVYPMRKSLDTLTEESATLLKPRDGQWLRGGTTFLRPLFEIRRFMFNQTTIYLDPATSVVGQCDNFTAELENPSNKQLLRVHFTPSVFRAFVDYVRHKFGEHKSWTRVYWMVIGGESLSTQDLALAKGIFPEATLACNYACSEVGFAGVSQQFVRPSDSVPDVISFDASQGCEDFVLLNDAMEIVPRMVGATGIIGMITTQSATHYLDNPEATAHMFRPWGGDRILLYTDDIGCIAPDGRVVVNGRRSRNVKINGLFVDLDFVESALMQAFAPAHTVTAYKLVKSKDERIVLLWSGASSNMDVLRRARETLRVQLGDSLAMVVASAREIAEMPYNASYKIDLARLQALADADVPAATEPAPAADEAPAGDRASEIALAIAEEVGRLSNSFEPVPTDIPLTLVGLNSITVVQLYFWLQSQFDWDDDMTRLFEEDLSAEVLARDIVGDVLRDATVEQESAPVSAPRMATISLPEPVVVDAPQPPAPKRTRLTPKAPLSVKVLDAPTEIAREPATVPLPVTATPFTPSKEIATSSPFDIGMAPFESWTGSKGSISSTLMFSLFALGVLGSPLTSSFRPEHAFGPSTATFARGPRSAHTPVLSPWLDAVHLSGMESVQSPWAGAASHAVFPQSPACVSF